MSKDIKRGKYRIVKFVDKKTGKEHIYTSEVGAGAVTPKIKAFFGIKNFEIISSEPLYVRDKDLLYTDRENMYKLPKFSDEEIYFGN